MSAGGDLCAPYISRDGDLYRCGRLVLERVPEPREVYEHQRRVGGVG